MILSLTFYCNFFLIQNVLAVEVSDGCVVFCCFSTFVLVWTQIIMMFRSPHQISYHRTTTIGKLAHRLRTEGNQTVLMAACDTFRAGAVEQLVQWAERAEVDIFTPNEKRNSPSAVLYGALDKAIEEKYDTVLVDTSGRLSNNDALTAELAKMKRVIQKRLSVENDSDGKPVPNKDVPHESLLVLDAAQGRMALDSARVWNKEIGLSGLVLTKLDGSAKGGSVVAVSRDLKLPVKLIGVGEGINDLRDVSTEALLTYSTFHATLWYGF